MLSVVVCICIVLWSVCGWISVKCRFSNLVIVCVVLVFCVIVCVLSYVMYVFCCVVWYVNWCVSCVVDVLLYVSVMWLGCV